LNELWATASFQAMPFAHRLSVYFLFGQIAVAWLAAFCAAQDVVRAAGARIRAAAAASLGLFSLALVVRWVLPVHALMHENRHGYQFSTLPPFNIAVEPHGVVSSHAALIKLYAYLTPFGREPIFELGVLLSSLAVLGAFWYARMAFGSTLAGFAAAVLLLGQPVALALAPTEEFMLLACGLCLPGMALLLAGVRHRLWSAWLSGVLLICIGASAREIALPLAALAPIVHCGAEEDRRRRLRGALITGAACALMLLPRAIVILRAARVSHDGPALIAAPALPFRGISLDHRWVGWQAPYVPRWLGVLAVVSLLAMIAQCVRRRDLRLAMLGVAPLLVAHIEGGLVVAGWFPSNLRHQLFAIAMWMLPCGWLVAELARISRERQASAVLWAAPAVAVVATLVATPRAYRLHELPMAREFTFFDSVVRSLPERATVVQLGEEAKMRHLGSGWLMSLRPQWNVVGAGALEGLRRSGGGPTYLLLDRTCFLNTACIGDPDHCGQPAIADAVPVASTQYGRMQRHCRAALDALPWREVATTEVRRLEGRDYDLPSVDAVVRLAVLQWDGKP